jgi:transposase
MNLAFELGWSQWMLVFTIGHGQPARLRTIGARDLTVLHKEIAKAMRRFGLPDDVGVVSCYEAGRDGFWPHRCVTSQGVANVIVNSASIVSLESQPPEKRRDILQLQKCRICRFLPCT